MDGGIRLCCRAATDGRLYDRSDLLRRQHGERQAFWRARLRQTVHTRARLRAFEQVAPRVLAANSSRLDHVSGRGWLAVGDAAMALDPLSSQGLKQALASGIRAGEALNRHLVGEAAAIGEYDVKASEVFREYARLHGVYYGRERRWPESDFWTAPCCGTIACRDHPIVSLQAHPWRRGAALGAKYRRAI